MSQTVNYKAANTKKNKPERWTSYQNCSVNGLFYETLNGEASNDRLTDIYWAFKEVGQISVDTSFMLCSEATCDEPLKSAELTSVDYSFFDFGFEKPVAVVEEPVTPLPVVPTESSAVYFAAVATVITALMAF